MFSDEQSSIRHGESLACPRMDLCYSFALYPARVIFRAQAYFRKYSKYEGHLDALVEADNHVHRHDGSMPDEGGKRGQRRGNAPKDDGGADAAKLRLAPGAE